MEKIDVIKSKFMMNLFDQNTYVVSNESDAVIIDAGAELEDVKQIVGKKKVHAILLTHIHFDHIWNIEEYIKEFDTDIYIVNGFDEKFESSEKNCSTVVRKNITKNVPKNKIKYYENNLKFGNLVFDVFFTPGHSADSVCILFGDTLFSGDTIFADGVGRTDLYDSDNNKMVESLKTILNLNFVNLYSGHYDKTTKEKAKKIIEYYI